jgi:hypothetical protein
MGAKPLLARGAAGAVDARDLLGRYFVFGNVAPGHQMCQISAKPVMVAKNAVINPTGLLRGTSIAS